MPKKTTETHCDKLWEEVDEFYEQSGLESNPDKWKNILPEEFTCYKCEERESCIFVDDAYNTDGECLAMK